MKISKFELCLVILQVTKDADLTFNQINKKILAQNKDIERATELLVKNGLLVEKINDFEIVRYGITPKGRAISEYFIKSKPSFLTFTSP